jgi:predicted RNA-binding Zn ribbon-like protein
MPLPTTAETRRIAPRRPPHFDLIAGNVALDFVNTLDDRYIKPKELLGSYIDLVRFGEDTGVLAPKEAERLCQSGTTDSERAQRVLRRGRELREAIHDVFRAITDKRPVPAAALARLNADVQDAAAHLRLVPVKEGFEWRFDDMGELESALWPIARSAADLLASDQKDYVRTCFSKTCEWFFLDTSKNHHRRWCDMTRCGNRAKVKRFYVRQKKANS